MLALKADDTSIGHGHQTPAGIEIGAPQQSMSSGRVNCAEPVSSKVAMVRTNPNGHSCPPSSTHRREADPAVLRIRSRTRGQ